MEKPNSFEDRRWNPARWTDDSTKLDAEAPPVRQSNWPTWFMVAAVVGAGVIIAEKYVARPSRPATVSFVSAPQSLPK